jgi:hypothetical protein
MRTNRRIRYVKAVVSCTHLVTSSGSRRRASRHTRGPKWEVFSADSSAHSADGRDTTPKQGKSVLVVPGECGPVGGPLLQKGVAAFDGLIGHVRQPGRLTGEELLADQAVIDQVEGVFEHPLRGG